MENKQLWDEVLEYIRTRTTITPTTYSSFISHVKLREINENPNIIYLETPKEMIANIIHRRYLHHFADAFSYVTGKEYKAIIKSSSQYKNVPKIIPDIDEKPGFIDFVDPIFRNYRVFDPSFTFDNFVVGECNNTAYAISKAISESPGDLFNPFFLYGKSGLGKTHLLNAIGIYLLENNQDIKVLYVTSETFINDFISSLQSKRAHEFREKYRKPDVLLIDDVQFLKRALETQNELFNTFDHLYMEGKQIILSGDRPPSEFTFFDERLVSRFMSNTTIDIKPPDYEMKCAILYKLSENMNVEVDDEMKEIIEFIADKNTENIRVLKGYLTTIINVAREIKQKPTLQFASNLIKDIAKGGDTVTPQKIKSEVAKYYNINISDLDSNSRRSEFTYPRHIAIYLCRTMTDYSLPRLGDLFGNRHYSTIKHACDKIEGEINIDFELKNTIEEIRNKIRFE